MKRRFSKILGVGLTVVLLFSLMTMPVLATISGLTLIVAPTTISAAATYTMTFSAGAPLTPTTDTIIITFDTGVNIANVVPGNVTVEATAGIGGAGSGGSPVTAVTAPVLGQVLTVTVPAGCPIGSGSLVQVVVTTNIFNPGTVGTFNVTVATSAETTAVSASFTSTAPAILPLPGVVERYNSAGVLMQQTNVIQTAINAAAVGDSILVGPGTYDEIIDIDEGVTITGNAADTFLEDITGGAAGGVVTISQVGTATVAGAVLDGFTIKGTLTGAAVVTITGNKATIQNCVFTKVGLATTAIAQTMISNGTAAGLGNTITNNTFDTTLGTVVDTIISVPAGSAEGLTISNNTFVVDGAITAEDIAIAVNDGTALFPTTISNNAFSGGSGLGVQVNAGVAVISDNTFAALNQAVNVVADTATTITGNSIDACGLVISTTAAVGKAAISVTATTALSITNNTITNSPDDIIEITDDVENINMMFNNLTDNTIGIDNNDAGTGTEILNATHNWWGVDTGPATGFNVTAGTVNDTTSYLGSEATGSFTNTVGAVSLLTQTTVGVDVIPNSALLAGDIIGVANYAANPQAATPLPAIAGGFYDVYVEENPATAAMTSVLIKFYNANVTANTTIYVWGTIAGGWQPCTTQGVNTYGGYAYVTVTTTTPDIAGLAGTPFALVAAPTTAPTTVTTLLTPKTGADTVSLTPIFAWEAVPGAAGYYFELADNANFVVPMVSLTGDLGRLVVTAYAYVGELPYSKAYYWRVKAVSGTVEAGDLAEGAWASGVFITMAEPEEEAPPIVVEEVQPPVIVVEQPDIIVPLPAETPITPSWIYVIIGVGAVLVIALLVLIVRTRRVA